jgi:hypothetical protein
MIENENFEKALAYVQELRDGFKTYGNLIVVSDELKKKIAEMNDKELDMLAARLTRTYYNSIRKSLEGMKDE